ncbi:hypothetical protein ACFRR7_34955 [Streptomyces sp. NPDC056909]|uniref:hypothetical protein n=1 Tax=Streptomyces sp. NPDC056909 TaxID=3345963 RepID=UPI0036A0F965
MVAGLTLAVAPSAAAASYSFEGTWPTYGRIVLVKEDGYGQVGLAEWRKDPGSGQPGDALRVYDQEPDGYGIEAHLSDGRKATTRGHDSPYWSPWATGDLPEDRTYTMRVCAVKGSDSYCSGNISVSS